MVSNETIPAVETVGWNLSQGIINEITYLLQGATRYYIAGNIPKALYYLQGVRMRISPHLDEKEMGEMRRIEKDFMANIHKASTKGFARTDNQKGAYVSVCIIYTLYNDLLMGHLKKYGYLIPKKEDRTIMIS